MKISFLLQNAYGIGGTIRSTFNVAGALAARHDVEIVSIHRTGGTPKLPLDRKVRLVHLIDQRADTGADRDNPLLQQDSAHIPPVEAKGAHFSALTDKRVAEHLARTDADVVIATRPGLVMYLAEFGQDRYLRIGQEHRIYGTHEPNIRAAQDLAIPHLDAHTAVSDADAATHREHFPGIKTKLIALPNGVPASEVEPSDGSAKLVVAAGRLIPVKRYDLLVKAWATVAATRPDWKLRIYGRGPQQAKLREQIDQLGLNDHITLMGAHSPIETEWAKGSIAAVTSREESFGMTIVEAMNCGVPVVATDCPHGPGEIISDGHDGLLVTNLDSDAIAKGLLKLIEDDELRRDMGRAALVSAERYHPDAIARRYEELIASLGGDTDATAKAAKPGASGTTADAEPKPAPVPLSKMLRRTAGKILRPLRRGVAKPATPPVKAALKEIVRKPLRCTASCRVDADGNIVVSVDRKGLSGDKLSLTVTRRKEGKPVAVPLKAPAGTKGPWTAVLDRRELKLGEGRWDLHVVRGEDGARRRVVSHLAEGRGLVELEPLTGAPFTWWVPYPTVDGFLALRAWHRTAHAEARAVRQDKTTLTVEGTLHGTEFTSDSNPVAVGTPRVDTAEKITAEVTVVDESSFTVTLPYDKIRAARSVGDEATIWDLALRLTPDGEPIKIARLIGDIVDRNKTDLYPTVDGVKPYFTVNSDLAVSVPAS
ncbi:glycosyltransferase family 4 protein [Streptomyces albireticuli]|uniref:D-inositol 3-phosphate glycosyltransferase n=1 Tax=Streptomyces albireticuli TaxID=1940 RepID=A0A2A2D8W9_9ACTN|nr:glycosyltransferase family 4 protein [Streptomyces albireticuli]MCD9144699.1 glycosyltransferase family 4 protein [Streptomyces albireticuli]MCD9165447.1 glycosyltransferase family 4 protein [Streptomyces albireticuli]MCD9193606.1 glycosyltransferase family 4 protein [Streptomyces albireticuli]PAU48933.1 glycosyl transferase family 1 [Streptomyces albireticuli]